MSPGDNTAPKRHNPLHPRGSIGHRDTEDLGAYRAAPIVVVVDLSRRNISRLNEILSFRYIQPQFLPIDPTNTKLSERIFVPLPVYLTIRLTQPTESVGTAESDVTTIRPSSLLPSAN